MADDGAQWDVVSVPRYKNGKRYGDGDTVRLIRTGVFKIGDKRWRLTDVTEPGQPPGEAIRLVWLDTPESNTRVDWERATAELTAWIDRKLLLGPLRVLCYDSAGWDRVLGDLIAADGESASMWMLAAGDEGRGWPRYEG